MEKEHLAYDTTAGRAGTIRSQYDITEHFENMISLK
jgi:hypothetical protein